VHQQPPYATTLLLMSVITAAGTARFANLLVAILATAGTWLRK
jgi:hypothetical protein